MAVNRSSRSPRPEGASTNTRTSAWGKSACPARRGGCHSANFCFRPPDLFDALIALSGVYQLRRFVGDYMDDNIYFNTPLAYLPGLAGPWSLARYRNGRVVVCAGQGAWEDEMLADTLPPQ